MLASANRTSIFFAFATALMLTLSLPNLSKAQSPEYQRRLAALQEARNRGAGAASEFNSGSSVRVAGYQEAYAEAPATAQPPQRVAATAMPRQSQPRMSANQRQPMMQNGAQPVRVASNPRMAARPTRTAQLAEQPMMGGGSPVVDQGVYEGVVEQEFHGEYVDGGNDCGGYCDDGCCDRGGCCVDDCWLTGLGGILYRGDYFFGAQGFQTPMIQSPVDQTNFFNDNNFGFYGGANLGIPLCGLSCGLFSGQVGVRTVQTNFGGSDLTGENRNQTFLTTGLFRRVDYGLQGGVVADILWENWYTETMTVQLRSDIGYLWAGGTSFGFRYATNLSEDTQPALVQGVTFANLTTFSEDQYRFYIRHEACTGGYGEIFAGWSDTTQAILGGEIDVPITERLATQAGVAYYMDDTELPIAANRLGGYQNEAWNVYAGFAWRPSGRCYYKGYDRPFFNVADNGTMLLRRR